MWYVLVQNEQLGPMERDELANLCLQGVANADSSVWCQGMTEWRPLKEVEDLSDIWGLALQKNALDEALDEEDGEGETLALDADAARELMQAAHAAPIPQPPRAHSQPAQSPRAHSQPAQSPLPSNAASKAITPPRTSLLPPTGAPGAPILERHQAAELPLRAASRAPQRFSEPALERAHEEREALVDLEAFAKPSSLDANFLPRTANPAEEFNFSSASLLPTVPVSQPRSSMKWVVLAAFLLIAAAIAVSVVVLRSSGGSTPSTPGSTQELSGQPSVLPQPSAPAVIERVEAPAYPSNLIVQPVENTRVFDLKALQDKVAQAAGRLMENEQAGEEGQAEELLTFDVIEVPQAVARTDGRARPRETPKEPKVIDKKPQNLPVALSREQIERVVKSNAARLQSCIAQMPENKGTTINVQVTIKRDGNISAAQVTTSRVRNSEFARCVESQVKTYKFEPFTGDPMRIQLPFSL